MSQEETTIELDVIAKLEWNSKLELEVVEVEPPPEGSFIELPGPKRRPTRPYLDPFAGPGGLVARVLRGDGQVLPVALLFKPAATRIPLPEPPLALSSREDGGVWVLNKKSLVYYDAAGAQVQTLDLSGITLVGSANSAVWVINLDSAWWVDASGQIRGPYPWPAGPNSAGSSQALCARNLKEPSRVHCLEPSGQEQFLPLPSPLGPFEQLLWVTDQEILTIAGAVLRRYNLAGEVTEVTIQAAGLTQAGEAFASGRSGDRVNLWVGHSPVRQLPLSPGRPAQGAFRVIAVAGTRSLVYGLDYAAWHDGDHIETTFVVDDLNYRNEVFPHLWSLGPTRFATASPDGTVILSTTGPVGVALIALGWPSTN